ncbi:ComEC/Rec2 family competence protein [Salibacter sp.]|uniref:ComEC/Rec2 family competence protein n=1 Tax=Salibacter sp. TaxID=2010995 RepID=UPI0038F81F39
MSCSLLLLLKKYRRLFGVIAVPVFMLFGYLLAESSISKFSKNPVGDYLNGSDTLLIEVVEEPHVKENSIKAEVEVLQVVKGEQFLPVSGKAIIYFDDTLSISYGDQRLIATQLNEIDGPKNPGQFDYKRYLFHHHIYHSGYVASEKDTLLSEGNGNPIQAFAISARQKLMKQLAKVVPEKDEHAIASALILGYKDELTSQTRSAFASAGAMHVLAVSGLHVGIIYLVIEKLLKIFPLLYRKKWLRGSLLLGGIWSYAILTGLSASVIRAATMLTFVVLATVFNRHTNIYNTIAASAFFILLVFGPFRIMEVGMQLSYLAVLGIILIQPWLSSFLTIENRILRWVWEISCVSVSAQLATAPLGFLYFHQFPNYFLLSNLAVIPCAFLILTTGLIYLAVSIVPFVGEFVGYLLKYEVRLLDYVVSLVDQLPNSILAGIDISILETYLIYFIIGSFLFAFMARKKRAFFYLTTLLVIFLGFQIVEKYAQSNQQVFTVYSTRSEPALAIINGSSGKVYSTASFLGSDDQLLFHVDHHLWKRGLLRGESVSEEKLQPDSVVYEFDDKVILHLFGDREQYPQDMNFDWVVISDGGFIPVDFFASNQIEKVIFDATNSAGRIKALTEIANENNIEVYDVAEEGAFVFEKHNQNGL